MAIRSYKLELTDPTSGDVVAFGPRKIGEAGRDILIVKRALGQIKPFSELIDSADQDTLQQFDGSWLDCSDGSAISNIEASIFDSNMETYLTKFQLDNQFYILCYLFSKFSVNQNFEEINELQERSFARNPEIEKLLTAGGRIPNIPGFNREEINDYLNSQYVSTQIGIITRLFEIEFGNLGEATIAVLHGWRPRTKVGATSYFHDPRVFETFEGAYDLVLLGLYDAFTKGLLTQKISNSPDILKPQFSHEFSDYRGDKQKGRVFLSKYQQQVSAKEQIQFNVPGIERPEDYVIKSSYFGAFKYRTVDESERSPLYNAFTLVSEQIPRGSESGIDQDLSDEQFKESLLRGYEPNPLTDPDPFVVDRNRIMFFDKTEYTLKGGSIPPDPASSMQEIRQMEERALRKVFEYYGKPMVWIQDPQNPRFETLYGYDMEVTPSHDGTYVERDKFVLTTSEFVNSLREQGEDISSRVQNFRAIEGDDIEPPLIKFIEFISPSLRPTDVYRARFEINRHKLDNIIEGVFNVLDLEELEEGDEPEGTTAESPEAVNQEFTCEGEQVSKDEQERRYREYKALAAKHKQEIARTIREKTIENYQNETPLSSNTIDLGVFGNAKLDLGNGEDSYSYTANVASSITGMFGVENNATNVKSPKLADLKEINLNYLQLQFFCESAAKNLEKAYKNCLKDNIVITPADYNGLNEARRLRQIPGELRAFIEKRTKKKTAPGSQSFGGQALDQFQEATGTGSNFDFGTDSSENLSFSGFLGTGGIIKIRFEPSKDGKGLKVSKVYADGKDLTKNKKNLIKEVKSLAYPRTVGYLAQIEQMSEDLLDILGFRSEACQSLGIGNFGLSFIMKHTLGLTSNRRDSFNPISKWVSNEVKALQERVKEFKSINQLESQLNVKFGVDEVLNVFGKQCSGLENTVRNLFKRFSFGQILCELLRCIRLPTASFNIPDLTSIKRLLSLIDISIFGWYKDLIKNLVKIFFGLLTQFLCTFAKALVDILNQPFCQEQLRDQLYGSGADSTSPIKRALVEGLTDLSLDPNNVEKSKDLIDGMAVFLTGEELCRILQGGPIDAPTMNMIMSLADSLGIEEANTEEKLKQFFQTISIFLPPEFCENLNQSTSIINAADCSEVSTYASQVRRRLLANEATDEEIQRAIDIANKNLQDQFDSLKALATGGLDGIVPKVLKFGDPEALINDFPEALSEQINRAVKSVFTPAHTGYISSLSRFGPSLFQKVYRLPQAGDSEYNIESYIITQTILQNLRLYTSIGANVGATPSIQSLTQQLHVLYQVYELTEVNGAMVPAFYLGPRDAPFAPQKDVGDYPRQQDLDSLSNVEDLESRLFLNPVGFLENNYYFEDPDEGAAIINRPRSDWVETSLGDLRRPLSGEEIEVDIVEGLPQFGQETIVLPSYLDGFSFIGAYKIVERAEEDDLFSNPSEGRMGFLLERIQQRLGEMQSALQANLQNIANPVNDLGYLKFIREELTSVFENRRENNRSPNTQLIRSQILDQGIDAEGQITSDERNTIDFGMNLGQNLRPFIRLNEFRSTNSTNKFDPYSIEVGGENALFSEPQYFEFCDTVPGPGLQESDLTEEQLQNRQIFDRITTDIPPNIYTRREIFARKYWENVKSKVDFIFDRAEDQGFYQDARRQIDEYINVASPLKRHIYENESVKFSEGIVEQLMFALERSRIYDEQNYYPELNARVSGLAYFDNANQCYKNRYNVSQFGILSFEKIVTDELATQISKEIAKPENDPYNRDFDDLDPIQKAIQNVCMIGFIRVCIVELLLKGSLAYSVWDMEGVMDEPFMKEFFIRFVEEEIKRHPSLAGKWQPVASRISGVDQPQFAIREIVQTQMIKIAGASKKIFQNDENEDYYNWFVRNFVPQAEVSKTISPSFPGVESENFEAFSEVDRETGNIVDRNLGEGELAFQRTGFLWEHPIQKLQNIIVNQDGRTSASQIRESLFGSNNRFFHIEHFLEVSGPLARLESLIIPSRTIAENIINNIQTKVDDDRDRDIRVLPIVEAYERTNLPPINLDDYNLRNVPEIQGSAAGTTAEDERSFNQDHEIYNIDDFVSGLKSVLNKDDLEKIVLHYRGLMHFSGIEGSPIEPGGKDRNTSSQAANGMPEVIRRAPTRFITKTRRVLAFSQDFVTHDNNSYFALNNELNTYKNKLYSVNPSNIGYAFGEPSDRSILDFGTFANLVHKVVDDQNEYYILTSNGEQLALFADQGVNVQTLEKDDFFNHLVDINLTEVDNKEAGSYVDYTFQDPQPNQQIEERTDRFICVKYPERESNNILTYSPNDIGDDSGKGRNIIKNIDLWSLDQPGPKDYLLHRQGRRRRSASRGIFENIYGKVNSIDDFELAKSNTFNPHEERWVETVFSFTGPASVIAGLHGSFSIGDTMDPACRNFVPSEQLIELFNGDLRDLLENIHGDDAFENANNQTNDNPGFSVNRTLNLIVEDDRYQPYISRHMGISPDTNNELTKLETSENPESNNINFFASFVGQERRTNEQEDIVSSRNHRKNVISKSPVEFADYDLDPTELFETNVLPPNFYKIPMRVLLTQVYDGDSTVAREVYCRVVLPKYIQDMYVPSRQSAQIEKLNNSLSKIATEYLEYYNAAIRQNLNNAGELPFGIQFSTDFTNGSRIGDGEVNPNLDSQSSLQYCSIENIYHKIFEEEVNDPYYNSREELDALFADRGGLVIDRPRPEHSARFFPEAERDSSVFVNLRQYMESCTQFYRIDTDITTIQDVANFHNTIFSLSNVFQWYLRNRRRDTLWGSLTPPLTHITWPEADSGVPYRASPNQNNSNLVIPRNQARTIPEFNVGGIRPQFAWVGNLNVDPDFRSEMDLRLNDYHGAADEGITPRTNSLYRKLINKTDFSNWTFYGSDSDGLISDGKGSECVNYNFIEHCPFKNAGQSIFYGNGIISHVDISNLISSCIRALVEQTYRGEIDLPIGNVGSFIDINSFFDIESGKNLQVLRNIVTPNRPEEDVEVTNFVFNGYERQLFPPSSGFAALNLEITEENVDLLLSSLQNIILRLYRLSASQSAFSVKSEASRYNRHILESPYKLGILVRFINKIQERAQLANQENQEDAPFLYNPFQKIYLLAMAANYNFADSLIDIINNTIDNEGVDEVENFDQVPPESVEELKDWMTACIHFLAVAYLRFSGMSKNKYGGKRGIFRLFSKRSKEADVVYGNPWVYRLNPEVPIKIDEEFLVSLAGERGDINEKWDRLKGLYDLQPNRVPTNYSVKEIIKISNELFHDLTGLGLEGYVSAGPGQTYANNNNILDFLLNPDINTPEMIGLYGQKYRQALSRANAARNGQLAIASYSNRILSNTNSRITNLLLSSVNNPDGYARDTGLIEEFILKLDNRLFFNLFGEDDRSTSLNTRVGFFEQYFENRFRPKFLVETVSDYYRNMVSDFLYKSRSFRSAAESLADNIKSKHLPQPNLMTNRWKFAFKKYTGIDSNAINLEMFQQAVISGQMISGLFTNSEIKQVCRLVSNNPISPNIDQGDEQIYNNLITQDSGPIQQVSEEFRSFRMTIGEDGDGQMFCVPMAEYSKMISAFGEGLDDCYDILTFKQDYKRLQPWMTQQLIETDEAKQVFQYIYPVKRYQAVTTAFVTAALAGYGDMTSVMRTPKASLAALLSLAGLNRRESTQIFDNFSQAEFLKQMMDANASENTLDCFGFPFPEDFLKQFEDLLKELFSQFPSIFFRGIAQAIDPAYKEMRTHYMNCDINRLTLSGLRFKQSVSRKDMTAGVSHNEPLDGRRTGEYSSVLTQSPVDIGYGVYRAFWGDWSKLGRAIERLTGYIIKGPVSLLDGAFNFTVPCLGVDENWSANPWNADRYGHPLTPFTLLALYTDELPGDKRMRKCALPPPDPARDNICQDSEDSPFGKMPDPDE